MTGKVLFLDDRWHEEGWKASFDRWLPESVEAIYERDGYKALERLSEHPDVRLVFLDMQFEGQLEQGEQILARIKEHYPELRVIILTSMNDAKLALRLVHLERKAYYYFYKEDLDPDQIKKFIANAFEHYEPRTASVRETDRGLVVGESQAIREVLRLAEKASRAKTHVLITGESGTGKELIAWSIHHNSARRSKPLVVVNCAAIPKELAETELFGHVKGAFTNAVSTRAGYFEMATGGTLFLDEVGELQPELQAKMLRVIQSGEFHKVGSSVTQLVDVRIIAATHQDLNRQRAKGTFREDLYYRLNVFPIHVPPLRERKEDIPLLVEHQLQRLNDENGTMVRVDPDALAVLKSYPWPGNVRELASMLLRAYILADSDVLGESDFNALLSQSNTSHDVMLVDGWVKRIMEGKGGWQDVRSEYGAASPMRKKIIKAVILSTKDKQSGKRPKGDELAALLGVRRNHLNVILNELQLKLSDF